jgi:hypothetical protein
VYLVHNARRTLLVAALALAAVACKDDDPDRPPRPDTLPDTTAIGTPGEVTVTLFGGTAAPNLAPLAFAPKKDVIVRATTVANQYTLAWGAAANATSYRLTVTAAAFGAGTVGGLPSNATVNATTYTFTAVPPAAWESLAYTATVIGARGTRVGPSRTVTWKVVRPAPGQPGPISVDSSLAAAFLKAAPLDSVTIVQMASGETCRGEYAAIMSATFIRPVAPRTAACDSLLTRATEWGDLNRSALAYVAAIRLASPLYAARWDSGLVQPMPRDKRPDLPRTVLDTRMPRLELGPDTLVARPVGSSGPVLVTIAEYRAANPGFVWPPPYTPPPVTP